MSLIRLFARGYARRVVRELQENKSWVNEQIEQMEEVDKRFYQNEFEAKKKSVLHAYLAWMFCLHFVYLGLWVKCAIFASLLGLGMLAQMNPQFAALSLVGVMAFIFWWFMSGALMYFSVNRVNNEIARDVIEGIWMKNDPMSTSLQEQMHSSSQPMNP